MICNKKYKIIHQRHLNTHDINKKEYKEKYPNAKLIDKNHPQYTERKIIECDNCGEEFKQIRSSNKRYCSEECYHKDRRHERTTLQCKNCDKKFKAMNWELDDRKYCSIQCAMDDRDDKCIEVKCTKCNNILQVIQSKYEKQENFFCDQQCYHEYYTGTNHPNYQTRYTINCDHCNTKFNAIEAFIGKNNFCSIECQHKWQSENRNGENHPSYKGGPTKFRGEKWYIQRKKALERDNYKCQRCGKTQEQIIDSDHQFTRPDVHHIIPFRRFDKPIEANKLQNLICLCKTCHGIIENRKIEVGKELLN
jgi:hypothetical protein